MPLSLCQSLCFCKLVLINALRDLVKVIKSVIIFPSLYLCLEAFL